MRVLVLSLCITVSVACHTQYRGVVSMDDVEAEQPSHSAEATTSVYPAICSAVALPEYPEIPTEEQLGSVLIRVDFTVEKDGSTSGVTTETIAADTDASSFEVVSASTVASWKCNPAWRLRRDQSEPPGPIPLKQNTFVVFRFNTEAVGRRVAMESTETVQAK